MTKRSVDIQSVSRVGLILSLFGPDRESVSTAEASDLIGVNRTTTYRYLASLVATGLLERREGRRYGPGPTLLQLGAFALGQRNVMRHAAVPMAALARQTGITSVLSIWGEKSPVVSHVEEAPTREILVTVRVGMQLRSSAAQASVFHAFRADDKSVRASLNEMPDDEQKRVRAEAQAVMERGYSGRISQRGIAVLAVPVFDDRHMVASLGLLSTRDVLDISEGTAQLFALRSCADEISTALGAIERPSTNSIGRDY